MGVDLPLRNPALFEASEKGRAKLRGGACNKCGYVFFPMQTRGCECCGAFGDDLAETNLACKGQLTSLATVHLHAGKTQEAPFLIGVVKLDDGPVVRAIIDSSDGIVASSGNRVVGRLVPWKSPDGDQLRDLRFVPDAGA